MCYAGPTVAAIITTCCWKKDKSTNTWWLSLMFYGGSLFGIIDHLWNGELFLISKDWPKDLGLGLVITGAIFLAWKIIVHSTKNNPSTSTLATACADKK